MHTGIIALISFMVGICVGAGYAMLVLDLKVDWHAEDRKTVERI